MKFSNELEEIEKVVNIYEAIYMLLSARKLFISTPPLILLTLALVVYLYHHNSNSNNSSNNKQDQHQHNNNQDKLEQQQQAESKSRLISYLQFDNKLTNQPLSTEQSISETISNSSKIVNSGKLEQTISEKHIQIQQQAQRPARSRQFIQQQEMTMNESYGTNYRQQHKSQQIKPTTSDKVLSLNNDRISTLEQSKNISLLVNNSSHQNERETLAISEKVNNNDDDFSEESQNKQQQLSQEEMNKFLQTLLDINLDKQNFLLYNRCSSRVHVKINKRTRRAQLSAKQQVFSSDKSATKQLDSIKIKLLSMIITVESFKDRWPLLRTTTTTTINNTTTTTTTTNTNTFGLDSNRQTVVDNNKVAAINQVQQQPQVVGAINESNEGEDLEEDDGGPVNSASYGASGAGGNGRGNGEQAAVAASNRTRNPVRLRANLTELYICFDQFGSLEARVSSSLLG